MASVDVAQARVRAKEKTVRIVIADDHCMFRDGLRRLLADAGVDVVGEAQDGRKAVSLARQLKPDVLLLDLKMPEQMGMEALRELSQSSEANFTRIIVVTAEIEKNEIVEALDLGARGVVKKESATEVLLTAIQAVLAGEYWVGMERIANIVPYRKALRATLKDFGLTYREKEVARGVVDGMTNKQIAERLKIAEDTVKKHVSSIYDKTGASNRVELLRFTK